MFDVATVRIRGPLAGLLPAFVDYLTPRGYSGNSVRFLAIVFARLSGWLEAEGVDPAGLDWSLVDRFVAWSKSVGHRQPGSRQGMAPLVGFLIASGVVRASRFTEAVPVAGSAEDVAGRFVDYLVEFRGGACCRSRTTIPGSSWPPTWPGRRPARRRSPSSPKRSAVTAPRPDS